MSKRYVVNGHTLTNRSASLPRGSSRTVYVVWDTEKDERATPSIHEYHADAKRVADRLNEEDN